MAIAYKVLGQSNPSASTETVAYTVPASTEAVVSTITVANQGTAGSFRVGVSVGGGALGAADYIYHDLAIEADDTFAATFGITLATTDEIRVEASNANMSFNIFGTEIS